MSKILIAAHGALAQSYKNTIAMIVGEETASSIDTLCMMPDKDPETFLAEARDILAKAPDEEYLILADLFGASPCNTCLMAFKDAKYRLITGVNIPMLIELLLNGPDVPLEEAAAKGCEAACDGIRTIYMKDGFLHDSHSGEE